MDTLSRWTLTEEGFQKTTILELVAQLKKKIPFQKL